MEKKNTMEKTNKTNKATTKPSTKEKPVKNQGGYTIEELFTVLPKIKNVECTFNSTTNDLVILVHGKKVFECIRRVGHLACYMRDCVADCVEKMDAFKKATDAEKVKSVKTYTSYNVCYNFTASTVKALTETFAKGTADAIPDKRLAKRVSSATEKADANKPATDAKKPAKKPATEKADGKLEKSVKLVKAPKKDAKTA